MVYKKLLRLAGLSLLIWLTTNVLGSLLVIFTSAFGRSVDLGDLGIVIFFSLLFSSPVILVMIPNLYMITLFTQRTARIWYSIISTLMICGVLLFLLSFGPGPLRGYDNIEEMTSRTPYTNYVLSAIAMVLLCARRLIFSDTHEQATCNDH